MRRLISVLGLLLLSDAPSLLACEGCKAPSNVAGDSGVAGIGASFSWSVLFMIAMLGFLMGCLIMMMIRSCKQLAQQQQVSQTHSCVASRSQSVREDSLTDLGVTGFASPMRPVQS